MELTLVPFATPTLHHAVQNVLGDLGYRVLTLPAERWLEKQNKQVRNPKVLLFENGDLPYAQIDESLSQLECAPVFAIIGNKVMDERFNVLNHCCDFTSWPCNKQELAYRLNRLSEGILKERIFCDEDRLLEDFVDLNLIGHSPAFLQTLSLIKKIANYDAPVLIEGETGTGKELAARAIHYLSARRDHPFIPVNCGALPDNLIENELFGHQKGAFTDARQDQPGLIELAHQGALFLDEIETLSMKGQVALLRFLEDQQYRPLGGNRIKHANVRIIVASNVPMAELVNKGYLRQDLFFRLNMLVLTLPALRDRQEDIELLAEHFLEQYRCAHEKPDAQLSPHVLTWMKHQQWPGNVRELENFVYRELMLGNSDHIESPTQSGNSNSHGERRMMFDRRKCFDFDMPFSEAKAQVITEFERRYLHWVMKKAGGNVTQAAKLAGKERRALGKLLAKHELDKSS